MRRNVELNGLAPKESPINDPAPEGSHGEAGPSGASAIKSRPCVPDLGKVRVNEGDAW